MNVLVLSSLAQDTGSAIRAKAISQSLKRRGIKVEFIKPFFKSLPFKLDFLLSLPWYFIKVILTPADYLIAVKSYPNVGIPILVKKLFGTKIIIDTDDLSFAYSKGFWSKFSKYIQEIFLPLADLNTYHNRNLYRYLSQDLKIADEKTYFLPQGVDLKKFGKIMSSKKVCGLKRRLGLLGKKVLLFVGHFDIACDLDSILKAMPSVFKKYPDSVLLLVGDGKRKNELIKLAIKLKIEKRLIWIGLISQEKVKEYISVSDVCLIYYKDKKANYYRVSLKLREYLACGKKVVGNCVGDLAGFNKYTYQSSSKLESYSKMIGKVVSGYDDKRQIKGSNIVVKDYSWAKIGNDFLERLKKIE